MPAPKIQQHWLSQQRISNRLKPTLLCLHLSSCFIKSAESGGGMWNPSAQDWFECLAEIIHTSILLTISFFLMKGGKDDNKSHWSLVPSFQQTQQIKNWKLYSAEENGKGHVRESNLKIIIWTGKRDAKDQFTKRRDFLPKRCINRSVSAKEFLEAAISQKVCALLEEWNQCSQWLLGNNWEMIYSFSTGENPEQLPQTRKQTSKVLDQKRVS